MPADAFVTPARATTPHRGSSALERRKWLVVWSTLIGCLGVLDIYRMTRRDQSTLSETIRFVLHTDTPAGKAIFLTAVAVFVIHILNP
jgi:hypothetical protein